jgi:hypothetical protein
MAGNLMADVKMIPLRTVRRQLKPCCLCGDFVLHGAVLKTPQSVLVFRAREEDGVVWVPLKGHAHPILCPDPGPETAPFWHDTIRREAWKARRREHFTALRERPH